MAKIVSAAALLISVISSLFAAAANAAPADASQPISVLAERAAPICDPVEDPADVGAIVAVFDAPWFDQTKKVQKILTIPAERCIAQSLGKSVLLGWPIFVDATG